MEDVEDDLDLRFHKGLTPDVYYRCPTLESLDGALRNELDKSASALIPTAIVTEFVFTAAATLTIPVTHQPKLDALIQSADFPQTITVQHALCRRVHGKDRDQAQRAIARSIIDAIQGADGFRYKERSMSAPKSGDGARFRYVCKDSPQGRVRGRLPKSQQSEGNVATADQRQTYDCGGAVHVKFSVKREAINVVYKHSPIHTHSEEYQSDSALATESNGNTLASTPALASDAANVTKKRRRESKKSLNIAITHGYHDPGLHMSTSPEAPRPSSTKSRKQSKTTTSAKKAKTANEPPPPTNSRKNAAPGEPSVTRKVAKHVACVRCREKKIKCNEGKPSCNQCQRGLWTCQYELAQSQKRSQTGCDNCKRRRRKCTEERPFCIFCIRMDDNCEYADYS